MSQMIRDSIYNTEYNTNFLYNNLITDNPIITVHSDDPGTVPLFNPKSLVLFISKKNFLCDNYPNSNGCLRN